MSILRYHLLYYFTTPFGVAFKKLLIYLDILSSGSSFVVLESERTAFCILDKHPHLATPKPIVLSVLHILWGETWEYCLL